MSTVGVILLVAFVIVCILLVLLVLIQDDGQSGMGGLLGGRGTAAFGSHSANVLTKSTVVLVVLFFVLAISLALVNKKEKIDEDLDSVITTSEVVTEENSDAAPTESSNWWNSADSADSK